jgi:hypothetical protein
MFSDRGLRILATCHSYDHEARCVAELS